MDFHNAYDQGFVRVAARVLPLVLADPCANADAVIADVAALQAQGVALAVYPELSLTGYSCDDLFLQDLLQDSVEQALAQIVAASKHWSTTLIVGAPLRLGARLFNCAVVIAAGRVLAAVPKSYLPNYREFYEHRWFASGVGVDQLFTSARHSELTTRLAAEQTIALPGVPGAILGIEICEDMWVPVPPHSRMALKGANLLVNLSGSPITIGKAASRSLLAQSASLRTSAAYIFTAAGPGESSTDLSWDGQTFVYEMGQLLGQSERFPRQATGTIVDVDLRAIAAERRRQGTFDDNAREVVATVKQQGRPGDQPLVGADPSAGGADVSSSDNQGVGPLFAGDIGLRRPLARFPFVPADPASLAQDCFEAYSIQVAGLVRRMESIGSPKLVIGVSGGLDSTHALIVAARALDLLGRPRSDILAFTMPGFATSAATKASALALMAAIGASTETIDIRPAAEQMLRDLGHPFAAGQPQYDVTFENVQAGLRTDYLFRIANQRGGIVVGTGDLSELALGWCTYGVGDQMSHYAVNTGVPKTLMQYLIRWVISQKMFDASTNQVLTTILGQEISPELVPPADGRSMQSTEQLIGPYALHDFFLYHFLRQGALPSRIAFLAEQAWSRRDQGSWPADWPADRRVAYDLATIEHWLRSFLKRFFANQFKRSALPNGPKVSAGGTLSPRGDWRMPSDSTATRWLAELDGCLPKKEQ
ncbi:MAG: NAD(+) synthase [Propionibacteriaceae bacterium]|jgi:NAD+ synthase (glutamine-hydrolysing)|nr:NAD(+) synthase [Propionibacteriaceae bacterium]